jgi:hypothetical protein
MNHSSHASCPSDEKKQGFANILLRFSNREWIAWVCILVTFIALACVTWAHWGSVRIDCGREMYVPQQLSHGKMLYRDLWYPYGPVAPYFNALLFRIFGDHLNVLYGSGLLIALSLAFVLYALSRRFVSPFVAYVVVFSFLLQAFRPNIFTYILPYSYASTLGSLLAFLFLYFLLRHLKNKAGSDLLISGLIAGLTLLTKTEFGGACYLTLGFYLLCELWSRRSWKNLFRELTLFLPGLLISAVGYGWFVYRLSLPFFIEDAYTRELYISWSKRQGLRFIPQEVYHLLLWSVLVVAVWFLCVWLVSQAIQLAWKVLLYRSMLAVLLVWAIHSRWGAFFPLGLYYLLRRFLFPEALFWLCAGYLAWAVLRWRRTRDDAEYLPRIILTFFALSVGIRIMSKVEPANYSIYYNSALFLVFALMLAGMVRYLGRHLQEKKKALLLTLVFALEGLGLLASNYPWRLMPSGLIQTTRGNIYAWKSESLEFPAVIQFIQEKHQQGEKILILPEETSLYFFAGIEAPSRWYMIHPGLLDPEDRQLRYIRELEAHGIDYVLFSNRTYGEYGFPHFGIDCDRTIYQWIRGNFEVVGKFGKFPFDDPFEFGMVIYKRRAETSPAPH